MSTVVLSSSFWVQKQHRLVLRLDETCLVIPFCAWELLVKFRNCYNHLPSRPASSLASVSQSLFVPPLPALLLARSSRVLFWRPQAWDTELYQGWDAPFSRSSLAKCGGSITLQLHVACLESSTDTVRSWTLPKLGMWQFYVGRVFHVPFDLITSETVQLSHVECCCNIYSTLSYSMYIQFVTS